MSLFDRTAHFGLKSVQLTLHGWKTQENEWTVHWKCELLSRPGVRDAAMCLCHSESYFEVSLSFSHSHTHKHTFLFNQWSPPCLNTGGGRGNKLVVTDPNDYANELSHICVFKHECWKEVLFYISLWWTDPVNNRYKQTYKANLCVSQFRKMKSVTDADTLEAACSLGESIEPWI